MGSGASVMQDLRPSAATASTATATVRVTTGTKMQAACARAASATGCNVMWIHNRQRPLAENTPTAERARMCAMRL